MHALSFLYIEQHIIHTHTKKKNLPTSNVREPKTSVTSKIILAAFSGFIYLPICLTVNFGLIDNICMNAV